MEYNWKEIFKNKSDRELYRIFIGKSMLSTDAQEFARIELERRNFNFENMDKHRRKWELENLIEEEKSYSYWFFGSTRSWEYLMMGFFGLLLLVIAIVLLLRYYLYQKQLDNLSATFFALAMGALMSIISFYNYKTKKAREEFRKKRIEELINGL